MTAITRRHATPLQKLSILKKIQISEPDITYRTDQSLTHQNAHQNSIPLPFLMLNKDCMGNSAYSYSQHKDKNGKKKFLLKIATVLCPANSQFFHSSSTTEYYMCLRINISVRLCYLIEKRQKIIQHSTLSFAHCKTKTNPRSPTMVV